jgi:hypothetical protein
MIIVNTCENYLEGCGACINYLSALGVVDNLLTFFGKQSQPYLTPIQEELFTTVERNYGIGEPQH